MRPNHLTVVANPAAGGGKFLRMEADFVEILRHAGWTVSVRISTRPGECESLAQNASADSLVCAAGGDGTVGEVINGLRRNADLVRLAIFPCGTGNDFAMAVGLPADPLAAARSFATGRFRSVDCGLVTWGTQHERLFCNVIGLGMDATANRRAAGWKRWLGKSAYTAAAVATLARWPRTDLRLVDADSDEIVLSTDHGLFVSICNGPRSGGGFVVTPEASVTDGRLDYCAVTSPGFLRGLRLLPEVKHGRHVTEPEVTVGSGPGFTVHAKQPQDMHIDGENLDQRVVTMSARVLPGAIDVLTPGE